MNLKTAVKSNISKIKKLRFIIEELSIRQKSLKKELKKTTDSSRRAKFQSRIVSVRKHLKKITLELKMTKTEVSKIPYGLNKIEIKVKRAAEDLNKIKVEYQELTSSQRRLKKALNNSEFTKESQKKTSRHNAKAQKEKSENKKEIKKVVEKRNKLAAKYAMLQDQWYKPTPVLITIS